MYPVLLRIGSFEITSFGAMMAIAALVGVWIFRRELRRSNLPDSAVDAAVAGVLGGLAGAKLLWVIEHRYEEPLTQLLFSRGGLSWFGGLVGGIGAGLAVMRWRRLPVIAVLSAATPALAIGHAIGRIGCFLVGDDYGRPSSLPWAVAFPQGLPPTAARVHPTQLYEAALLVPIAWLLFRLRRERADDRFVLGCYLIVTSVLRFLIEFIRVNERVALNLTVAQWACLGLVMVGAWLAATARPRLRIMNP
jgi:phosphatidylglycerol---prolipoprotein diacylglyceryl transferase